MNLRAMYNQLTHSFDEAGIPSPEVNTELIMMHVLNLNRTDLFLQMGSEIDEAKNTQILALSKQRLSGIPLQYIIGYTEFYGFKINVSPAVLIPRPETEFLVDWIETTFAEIQKPMRILEIGTGSGCIAIALATLFPQAEITAVDISSSALAIAGENARINQVEIDFKQSNLFEKVNDSYDLIVSNPPYISASDFNQLPTEIKDHEPSNALIAAEDGIFFYRQIIEQAGNYLKEKGSMYFKIGADQALLIIKIARNNGYSNIKIKREGFYVL